MSPSPTLSGPIFLSYSLRVIDQMTKNQGWGNGQKLEEEKKMQATVFIRFQCRSVNTKASPPDNATAAAGRLHASLGLEPARSCNLSRR